MKSSVISAAVLGAVVLVGCGVGVEAPTATGGQSQGEIIGGTIATGDPAVVSLSVSYGGRYSSFCTGTLVGPKTVLTAAHCISAQGQNAPYFVTFGTTAASPTQAVRVAQQFKNPMYNGQSNDFGLLRLERAVVNVTPIPMNDVALTPSLVGQPVRHVGFGVTNGTTQTGGGTKREITTPLRRVMRTGIEAGETGRQTCQGDSGGPGLMTLPGTNGERIVGVVSYGDQGCQAYGVDGRVDFGIAWLRTTMAAWEEPTCELDGACKAGCAIVDQDCACAADGQCTAACLDVSMDTDCPVDCASNGVCATGSCPRPDADCVPEGAACEAAIQCQGRACINDSQNPVTYCSRSCTASSDCASSMACVGGSCRFPLKPERQVLDSCVPDQDFCVASTCNGPQVGITRCVKACVVSNDCGAGANCEGGKMGGRYCRPTGLDFQLKTLTNASGPLGPLSKPGCSSISGELWFTLLALAPLRRRRKA